MSDDRRYETEDEKDLYEDLDEEEMYEILQEEKERIRQKRRVEKKQEPKRRFPRWIFWLIALFLFINAAIAIPSMFSLPAIDFVKTSAQLMLDEDVQKYRESIVTVDTGSGRGTGFSFTNDGYILTNYHVIEEREQLWVYFKEDGPYGATIEEVYPEIDLAVLKTEASNFPHLDLALQTEYESNEPFYFIGSPLGFSGIANEGEIIGEMTVSGIDSPVLMLDAPIYSGNSGSPVINESGEVIAIIYATLNHDTYGRIGLAVPIDAYYDFQQKE
ncbi:S1C family serine protease [Alkalibacillus aidingensis]|uniref:S1C family serine protease n=1 Tax=Alkalibacillus aidingensis TaxID=2747607 RepID=UPI0016612329|nr:serine protease [Alkalibacillus aidingensis]